MHYGVITTSRALITIFYRHPLFQSRCASVGQNLCIDNLPFVSGHTEIHIGNDVKIGGNVSIFSGRWLERPILIIKDRAQIGWNVELSINREIVIEEDARIASYCRLSDSDGHPRQADLRAQDAALDLNDIRPVRIGRYAWIGHSSHIMKGVTIGEGAVVAANSVVISNVPAYSLAMGNPAEIYFRGFGRPATPAGPRSVSG
jgi:acetyltransferase-like isoleucine patch superfamily enzyme